MGTMQYFWMQSLDWMQSHTFSWLVQYSEDLFGLRTLLEGSLRRCPDVGILVFVF